MATGETVGGDFSNPDFNYRPESVEVTLLSNGEQQLHLTYDNTTVRCFRESPDTNFVEVTTPNEEDETEVYIYRLFKRPDLVDALTNLGFNIMLQRYPDRQQIEAYASSLSEEWDDEWQLLNTDGVITDEAQHEPSLEMARLSPIFQIALRDGRSIEVDYSTATIYKIARFPDMSHIFINRVDNEGAGHITYLFSRPEIMEQLEAKGFTVVQRAFPLDEEISAYRQWVAANMDQGIARILYGDTDGGDEGLTGYAG